MLLLHRPFWALVLAAMASCSRDPGSGDASLAGLDASLAVLDGSQGADACAAADAFVADAEAPAPDCVWDVVPPEVHVGNVEGDRALTFSFAIRNRGAVVCTVYRLDLEPGSSAVLSLPEGPLENVEVPVGGLLAVPVTVAPTHEAFTGVVAFDLSSAAAPNGRFVVDRAEPALEKCILPVPSAIDFGAQKVGVQAERLLTLYNVCASELTVDGLGLAPGTTNEFIVLEGPVLPVTLSSGGSADVRMGYLPADIGKDEGDLEVTFQGAKRLVPLAGEGN